MVKTKAAMVPMKIQTATTALANTRVVTMVPAKTKAAMTVPVRIQAAITVPVKTPVVMTTSFITTKLISKKYSHKIVAVFFMI